MVPVNLSDLFKLFHAGEEMSPVKAGIALNLVSLLETSQPSYISFRASITRTPSPSINPHQLHNKVSNPATVLRKQEQSVNQSEGSGGSGQLCGNITHLEKLLCTNTDQPSSPLGFLSVATSLTQSTVLELIAQRCIRCRMNNSHKGGNKSYQSIANACCIQQLTLHDAE